MTIGPVTNNPSNNVDLLALDDHLDVALAGDSGAELAALLLLGARETRNQAKEAADAEEQHLEQLEDRQISELYAQADATRNAGWIRGAGQIALGTTGVIGANVNSGVDANSGAAGAATGGQGVDGKLAWTNAGQIAQGGSELLASSFDFEGKVHGTEATRADNRHEQAERRLQQLSQAQNDASQLARDAVQSASELSRTETATAQATIYLRG